MCLPLIATVQSIEGGLANVRLLEGEEVRVNAGLQPDVTVGEYVLLDRGLIIEVIAPEQVAQMLEFFTELTELWSKEDAAHA
ncbi:MAG: HypC/HybG/HupF family hydrogenase formation chaperone [Chloroflexia bacterium]|nr:HypC/HybG/HupF family hydrogenase formation chaperone [Chloroflexia bacterium]MDQ3410901.1 HypC/HybG/HupF family hydrogenase formation chaperone [Chloroflexota bacterium]